MSRTNLFVATASVPEMLRRHHGERGAAVIDTPLATFNDPHRRRLWNAGRALIKQSVVAIRHEQMGRSIAAEDLCVITRNGFGRGMRPTVFYNGAALPWAMSLAHADDLIGVAISLEADVRVGLDLVTSTPGTNETQQLELWMTSGERQLAQESGHDFELVIWGAKEAAYKANNYGQPFRPHEWEVGAQRGTLRCTHLGRELAHQVTELRSIGTHTAVAMAFGAATGPGPAVNESAFQWMITV